jgi:erythronate-4-phosphate dehydrogenase
MMKILADISIPNLDRFFPPPFQLHYYQHVEDVPFLLKDEEILLCRSTLKISSDLFKKNKLAIIGTASSGIDHIDLNYIQTHKVKLFDAKGSNANAVANYILACIIYLQERQVITGNKVGIIGFGEVGSQVAKFLKLMDYELIIYDPYKKKDADFHLAPLESLYQCNILCIHASLHDNPPFPSRGMLDAEFIDKLMPQTVIINTARGGIVKESDLLNSSKLIYYCTDVYSNEPHINQGIVNAAFLCTPHIAGHSKEAKCKAVSILSNKIHNVYGLSPPPISEPEIIKCVAIKNPNWQEQVLSFYHPNLETQYLKQAKDKSITFKRLRQEHKRNEFNLCYTF